MKLKVSGKERFIPLLLFIILLSACGVSSGKAPSIKSPAPKLQPLIEDRIKEWKTPSKALIGQERIYAAVLVKNFYKARNYEPAWFREGRLTQADELTGAVEDAYGDGLTPDYYHLALIRSLVPKADKDSFAHPALMVDIEMLLTDAFLTLGCHLSAGCVNPATIQSRWFAKHGTVDISSVLERALAKKRVRESLAALRPEQSSYNRLKKALAHYREVVSKVGEWPKVSPGAPLKKGGMSDRVVELRKRLIASDDLYAAEIKEGPFFDGKLEQAVTAFQKRHGLKADGVLGPATLKALNIPLQQRIRQIELNMERLRWILSDRERRSIMINIAAFELNVIEDWKPVFSMKVVVGRPYQRTPIFTAELTDVLINPPWNIPDSITHDEVLKQIRKNPVYLAEQNIKVLKGWGIQEEEIDPGTIDWRKVTARNFTYRLRQEPGPLNPLGRLKFVLPNKYDVYLHDTPARRLFSEDMRAFSHGCTRVEKPIELATYLLKDDPEWDSKKLMDAIEKGEEKKVALLHPLNVHFLYLTAWADEQGIVQFRKDIYGRDALLDNALRAKPSLK